MKKVLFFCAWFSLSSIYTVLAVDIDQATRDVDRPVRQKIDEQTRPSAINQSVTTDQQPQQKTTSTSFLISKIQLQGCKEIAPESFSPLLAPYNNTTVSLADLDDLASRLKREYLKMGVIAAVYVPPQEFKQGGVATLQVIESKMGRLEYNKHRYFNAKRIEYFWDIKTGQVIRYDKLAKTLFLLNKNPDREVRATLHSGATPGSTDILLDVKTGMPVHASASFDNEGSTAAGHNKFGVGARHNNFLGVDDTLLSGYLWGDHFDGVYGYHVIPVNDSGLSLMYGYSYSKSFPKKDYEPYGINSRARNSSIFLRQDLFDEGAYAGELYTGLDLKDKSTSMNTGTANRDRLRILRVGSTLINKTSSGMTSVNPEISQGFNGLGAVRKNEYSSRGAENTFTTASLDIQHKHRLGGAFQGNLKVKSQVSNEKLTPQEQCALGGIDSVRGYPSGDFLADNAVYGSAELIVPAFFIPKDLRLAKSSSTLRDDINPFIFFDYGYGQKLNTSSTEQKTGNLRSIGAGITIALFDQISLRLAWGFPVGDDSITEHGDSRFHIAIDFLSKSKKK